MSEVSLREHIEFLIAAEKEINSNKWKDHTEVHKSLALAVELALRRLEERLEDMNQFRAQISEERNTFLTIKTYDIEHKQLENRVNNLDIWKGNLEGKLWMLGTAFMVITVLLNLVFKWIK